MGKYFGTDGVRGVANEKITGELAYKIGRFIGQYPNGRKNKILLARDTRISGELLACALKAGIVSSGSDVYDLGVSTTPSVSYLVRSEKMDFGVMISASHNPFYDNGIKIFNKDGEKLEAEIELEIEKYIDGEIAELPLAVSENIGKMPNCHSFKDDYINFLLSKANPAVGKYNILVDCANGSASEVAPKLLDELAINAKIVNHNYDGININNGCGSTKIENLKATAKEGHYDVCFAFDGDADRCLVLDNNGEIIDGDGIIYLASKYLKELGLLHGNAATITVMSNLGLKKALQKEGISIDEVSVGDKYVQASLKAHNYCVGGEQSGHIIFLDDMNTGDGLLTMIKVLNIMASYGKPISELVKDLHIYPQRLKNCKVVSKEKVLNDVKFKEMIKEQEAILNGNGRILVRPSGTEPLIRIMVEAETLEICDNICNVLGDYVDSIK